MAVKPKAGAGKGPNKRSTKPSQSGSSSKSGSSSQPGSSSKSSSGFKSKSKTGPRPTPTQHKPKPSGLTDKKQQKKKAPHMRYTEKDLKVPQLNGIIPAGVLKAPNVKKGKNFVDDKESMNAIMAMVMAEKEGNLEGKMMRARQMEEVREAKRLEAEKRVASKKESLEERKSDIKSGSKKRGRAGDEAPTAAAASHDGDDARQAKKKRVSFG